MIQVTEEAAVELARLLAGSEPGCGLRLLVQKGGCAGWEYGMKIDSPREDDVQVETGGGRVLIGPESVEFLRGSTVDFSDALSDSGFKISNPNAARSCGCGTSFEPRDGDEEAVSASGAPLLEREGA